jgi:hypothetical protein
MLINALVQIVQGSHTSDVYFQDAVLVVLALESKDATAHAIVPDSKEWNEVDRSKKPFLF